jgi:hypothetical protein
LEKSTDLLKCHWFLRRLCQFFHGFMVMSEIVLAAHKDDWKTLTEMEDFRNPLQSKLVSRCMSYPFYAMTSYLLLDVVKGVRRVDSEADQDDMGIWVGQRTETIVIFLTRRIP